MSSWEPGQLPGVSLNSDVDTLTYMKGDDVGINRAESDLNDALAAAAADGEITTEEALDLQLAMSNWSLMVQTTTNMMKSMEDAHAAIVRNLN